MIETVEDIIKNCDCLASQEDDVKYYNTILFSLKEQFRADSTFSKSNTDDFIVYSTENKQYYIINDCGLSSIYKVKPSSTKEQYLEKFQDLIDESKGNLNQLDWKELMKDVVEEIDNHIDEVEEEEFEDEDEDEDPRKEKSITK